MYNRSLEESPTATRNQSSYRYKISKTSDQQTKWHANLDFIGLVYWTFNTINITQVSSGRYHRGALWLLHSGSVGYFTDRVLLVMLLREQDVLFHSSIRISFPPHSWIRKVVADEFVLLFGAPWAWPFSIHTTVVSYVLSRSIRCSMLPTIEWSLLVCSEPKVVTCRLDWFFVR